MHNRSPQHHLRGWRRIAAALIAAVLLLGIGAAVSAPARADDVADLETRARDIARRLMDLELQVADLGEQFNQAQVRLAQVKEDQTSLGRKLEIARTEEAQRRRDVSRYALAAYVGTGSDEVVPLSLDGRGWDLARRDGYVSSAIGRRQQVVDDLLASQKISADLLDSLDAAAREAEQLTEDLDAKQREASRLIAEQQDLQQSVQGELADAVAAQQAALAAQAQAEAQARQEAMFGAPDTGGVGGAATTATDAPGTGGLDTTTGASTLPAETPTQPTTTQRPGTRPTATTTPDTAVPGTPTTTPPVTAPPTTRPPTTVPPVVTPPPPASGKGQIARDAAMRQLGVRYSWGGGNAQGPSYGFGQGAGIEGFDCSGLTLYAWAQAGVYLYHSAQMQYDMSRKVPMDQLAVGDLVFYGSSSRTISHVGLYIGGGQVVHAPNSRSVVQTGSVYLWNGYYSWVGAGRPG